MIPALTWSIGPFVFCMDFPSFFVEQIQVWNLGDHDPTGNFTWSSCVQENTAGVDRSWEQSGKLHPVAASVGESLFSWPLVGAWVWRCCLRWPWVLCHCGNLTKGKARDEMTSCWVDSPPPSILTSFLKASSCHLVQQQAGAPTSGSISCASIGIYGLYAGRVWEKDIGDKLQVVVFRFFCKRTFLSLLTLEIQKICKIEAKHSTVSLTLLKAQQDRCGHQVAACPGLCNWTTTRCCHATRGSGFGQVSTADSLQQMRLAYG